MAAAKNVFLGCMMAAFLASAHGFAAGPGLCLRSSKGSLAPGGYVPQRRVEATQRLLMQDEVRSPLVSARWRRGPSVFAWDPAQAALCSLCCI